MKRLTCEMCGGIDLIKQEGVFACQYCGTKYSVEEAKKMMIDGTVEVAGTIKIDSSDKLKNLYQIARRAKDDDNSENAAKYYEMILIEDPNSWEAAFYVIYFQALGCKVVEIKSAAISVKNCIDTILKLIKDYVSGEAEQEAAVNEVVTRVMTISTLLYDTSKNHYNNATTNGQEYMSGAYESFNIVYTLGDQLESVFGDKKYARDLATTAWKKGVLWHLGVLENLIDKAANKSIVFGYVDKIRNDDAAYKLPAIPAGRGCYIATAVYGSYDCPQVWTLRRYRDNVLSQNWYGKIFIHLYYAISPTIVKLFGNTKWFNRILKKKLDFMAEKLNYRGVADTPYNDKE